ALRSRRELPACRHEGRGEEARARSAGHRAKLRSRPRAAAQRTRRSDEPVMKRFCGALGLGLLGGALWLGAPAGLSGVNVRAQPAPVPATPDSRFAGLQWTFVRIRYSAWT